MGYTPKSKRETEIKEILVRLDTKGLEVTDIVQVTDISLTIRKGTSTYQQAAKILKIESIP